MRALGALFLLFVFLAAASAADLKLKVVDPQSATVSGAQISLFSKGTDTPLKIVFSSAEGMATFPGVSSGNYQIQVLAPGFAPQTEDIATHSDVITIHLHLAPASETVVVTATRTPALAEETGSNISTLESGQLETMQPTAADDAVRFLPGAVVNTAGQRGGLSSLFVRGGESNYNKVMVDGVTINEPGGTFDFGTLPLTEANRMEFLRGTQSTLYGSDAMTSVVQVFTRTGSTRTPELRFGADGGNFSTANGNASFAGTRGHFDYNVFGDQFNTNGSGINDAYSDSLQGANLGAVLNDEVSLRIHMRHSNSHTGVPGEWSFNGYDPLVNVNGVTQPLQPDPSEWSQLNSLLGSAELTVAAPSGWQHRFTGFDYLYRYTDLNVNGDPARVSPLYGQFDFPSHQYDHINRVGFEYQGDYSERTWAHTTFGYRIENENGVVGDLDYPPSSSGQRLNQDAYLQQQLTWGRLSAVAGGRFVHSSVFGNTGVPRIALTLLARRGGETFSGTRLRFSYATGYKEPRLEETFAGPPYSIPNPGLKPERVRAFEAGIQQDFLHGKYVFNATYFNNLFHDQINYVTVNQTTFVGEYFNVNQAFAQGAEVELQARLRSKLLLSTAYTYTSTEILSNPAPIDSQYDPGQPLLRRPKHSATMLVSYLGSRWGANLSGSFVGRRPDDDFYGFNIDHAAGYVRADLGGWYAINARVTAYANVENALDRRYNEVVGYPALPINFRAGFRFRLGGE
ncbi:MAG: TonB-dependent receptor [Candidatus Sulfotelmatobacter sp.]|jgi:outer membrane cobalamin receptor